MGRFNDRKKFGRRQENTCKETREMGLFYHMCNDMVIIKLTCEDIPFPNSLVLDKNKRVIGKIEEVLGPQNEVYAAIKMDIKDKYGKNDKFYGYDNKFIPKNRFLVRSETEKRKEEEDKKKGKEENKRFNDRNLDRKRFGDRKPDSKRFKDRKLDGKRFGDRKKFKR